MKKDYMKPEMTAVEIQAEQFIATSGVKAGAEDPSDEDGVW